jgi:hypothetical protein
MMHRLARDKSLPSATKSEKWRICSRNCMSEKKKKKKKKKKKQYLTCRLLQ